METGCFDRSRITTEVGERACAFSPPVGWRGCAIDYIEMIRIRYQADPEFRASIESYGRFYQRYKEQVEITGPFVEQAVSILHKLAYHQHGDKPSQAAH